MPCIGDVTHKLQQEMRCDRLWALILTLLVLHRCQCYHSPHFTEHTHSASAKPDTALSRRTHGNYLPYIISSPLFPPLHIALLPLSPRLHCLSFSQWQFFFPPLHSFQECILILHSLPVKYLSQLILSLGSSFVIRPTFFFSTSDAGSLNCCEKHPHSWGNLIFVGLAGQFNRNAWSVTQFSNQPITGKKFNA